MIQLIQHKNRYTIFFVGYLVLYVGLLFFIGTRLQCWGDECQMVDITHQFVTNTNLDLLKHYEYPGTPLPFIIYGAWGKIFGDNLSAYRSLSLLMSGISYLVVFLLFHHLMNNSKAAFLSTVFVSLNPYMVGISMFFYRDMLAFLLIVSGVAAFINKKPLLFGICAALGILSSQFSVFLVLAAWVVWILRLVLRQETRLSVIGITFTLVAVSPTVALFIYWGGVSPDNSLRNIFEGAGVFTFRPNFLILYIILLFVYLSPVILFYWKDFVASKWVMISSLLVGCLYFLFPIRATFIPNYFIDTTGYFHKAIRLIFGERYEQFVMFAGFVLGLNILFAVILDAKARLIKKDLQTEFFIDLAILSFLMVMPFTFLAWEKYFLPLIPLVTIFILLTSHSRIIIRGKTGPSIDREKHDNIEAAPVQYSS